MIIWVNDYCLGENLLLALSDAPDARRVYVFDDAMMRDQHLGLKRLSMIHARAISLGCELYRGKAETVLSQLAGESEEITSYAVPCPEWGDAQARVAEVAVLTLRALPEFITPPKPPKLKRFMGFWKPLEKLARDPATWVEGKL